MSEAQGLEDLLSECDAQVTGVVEVEEVVG